MCKHLARESSVGWSKRAVGDISRPDSSESLCTISIAARESKPTDINGALPGTNVPSARHAMDSTSAFVSARAVRRVPTLWDASWCRVRKGLCLRRSSPTVFAARSTRSARRAAAAATEYPKNHQGRGRPADLTEVPDHEIPGKSLPRDQSGDI